MSDAILDRCIGLCALVVGFAVLFFASRLPLDMTSSLMLVRKVFGYVIGGALAFYGLYALIFG